jgi:periplasmic copper chaperone A
MNMVRLFLVAAIGAVVVMPAHAHVTIEAQEARVGASFKAVVKVPHGCAGSVTTAIRIKIPEGVIAVKPMPKPGWTLDTKRGPYEKTYEHFHDTKLSEGVTEVAWSGGKISDAHYAEFVFTSFLARDLEAGKTLYFPVVQECEQGVHRWIEIPAGKPGEHLDEPAPGVRLIAR